MKTLFDLEVKDEIISRIEKLTPQTTPLWGKMDVAQMLAHTNLPLEGALGIIKNEPLKPSFKNWIFQTFIKKMLYSPKPYGRSLPTSPKLLIVDERQFELEKARLKQNVERAFENSENGSWSIHPSFGEFTGTQWGLVHYKHLNHHLTQFGV